MQRKAERQKLLFILNNYIKLKKTSQRTEENATVLVVFRAYGYETLEEVNIPLGLKVVEALLNYYKINDRGIDEFIDLYFFRHRSYTYIANELHISERTARNWKREVIDRAELVSAMLKSKK